MAATDPIDPLMGWTMAEVVRALTRLSAALETFEDNVAEKYVPRELYDAEVRAIHARLDNGSSWLRELIAPLFTGIVAALVVTYITR